MDGFGIDSVNALLKEIDPTLEYIAGLSPSSVLVYKVRRDGQDYVLKAADKNDVWGKEHLCSEREILRVAKEIPGITHLVDMYGNSKDCVNILLKEFYEGESWPNAIGDTRLQEKLETTVRDLHSLGIADLDLRLKNIVVSSDKKDVRLVDLGFGNFSENKGDSWFKIKSEEDLRDLERMIFC